MSKRPSATAMRVFHREHAGRPIRVAWTLEELGEPYELTTMTREEGRSEEHRARHPLGRVPVLEDGDGFLFESAAICLHLADQHPDAGLVPPPGTRERALVYQWTIFAPSEIEPPVIELAFYARDDAARGDAARRRIEAVTAVVSEGLGENEYLVGGRFTVADVLVGTALAFIARAGLGEEMPANLKGYIARLAERPAFRSARERAAG